jgi:hypothetical protein
MPDKPSGFFGNRRTYRVVILFLTTSARVKTFLATLFRRRLPCKKKRHFALAYDLQDVGSFRESLGLFRSYPRTRHDRANVVM